jgi:hypothetical protein
MSPDDRELPANPKSYELVLDVVRAQIKLQDEHLSGLRTKASILLGSAGLILTKLIDFKPATEMAGNIETFGSIICAGAMVAALVPILPLTFRRDPKPGPFLEFRKKPLADVQKQLMVQWNESYSSGERQVLLTAWAIRVAAILLTTAVLLFLAAALVNRPAGMTQNAGSSPMMRVDSVSVIH